MTSEPTKLLPHPERVCLQLRQEIFQFVLQPGYWFTEMDIARRLGGFLTPVRDDLLVLQNESLVRHCFRYGWEVVPIDFDVYADIYETRALIEAITVRLQCKSASSKSDSKVLTELKEIWCVVPQARLQECDKVAALDEQFHITLTQAAGNRELTSILSYITEGIRNMRRLDFEYEARIVQTCSEHAELLEAIERRDEERAVELISLHIKDAHSGASNITLSRLQRVRAKALSGALPLQLCKHRRKAGSPSKWMHVFSASPG